MGSLMNRLVSALWAGCTALIIVVAILISIVRLMLPQIDHQRDVIEQWLSDVTHRPVQIEQVHASWLGWTPTIDVTNIALLTSDGSADLVRFEFAAVELSLLNSIRELSFVPRRLTVGGMQVALERDIDGNISIAGMPPSRWPVAKWLLQQQNFTLRDANITFVDVASGSVPTHFSDVTLSIAHEAGEQHISGRLSRRDSMSEKYAFSLRARGDILSSSWTGDLFVQIQQAAAESTLALAGWADHPVVDGQLNAKIWSHWQDAKLQRAAIELEGSALKFHEQSNPLIDQLSATIMALRHTDGWSVDIERLQVGREKMATGSSMAMRWRNHAGFPRLVTFSAKNLNLAELSPLLPNSFRVAGTDFSDLHAMNPRGTLTNVMGGINHDANDLSHYYVEASGHNLSLDQATLPVGISDLDFAIRVNSGGGIIDTKQTQSIFLDSDRWLVRPLEIQEIFGDIRWQRHRDELMVSSDLIQIHAEGIDFSTRGNVIWRPGSSPDVSIVSRINSGEIANLHLLVPKEILRPRGEAWLRGAFLSGHFKPSSLVVRGKLRDFPFDNGTGTLKGSFNVVDVDLKYSTRWPEIHGISATVELDKRRINTSIHKGHLYNAHVDGSTIEMPDLFSPKPVVQVRGTTRVTPDELGRFIRESPLKSTKAMRYSNVEISNPFAITLDMNLELAVGGEKTILGLVHFSGNRIVHEKQRITLEDVTGDISFTRDDWYGEGLQASFDGNRVGVVLNGGLDDPNYDTEFRMTGTSDATQLLKYLKRFAPTAYSWLALENDGKSISGNLPWKVVLTIPEASEDGLLAPQRVTIESSLLGLNVDLPWPFSKSQSERKLLIISIEIEAKGERRTRIDFGTTADIEIVRVQLSDGRIETRRAEVIFGAEVPEFRHEPGFSARGTIDRLPLREWAAFAKSAPSALTDGGSSLPASFDLTVAKFETLGQTFLDTKLKGLRTAAAWQLDISGDQAQGKITIPRGSREQTVKLDFERLWLAKADPGAKHTDIDPRTLPPLHLSCESFRFGAIDLGHTELVTSKSATGVNLDKLSFMQENFSLQGSGSWDFEADTHRSAIKLAINGATLGGLLKNFDYEVANIDGGSTAIEIEAVWGGMPTEFSLDKLHGSFKLRVDKGRFLDIEPGSGRLFGLLSLQTLPRRLSLDFNDLFKKGFTFDSIQGTFELENGNAYTNSLLMHGPSARIDISGRTGLADQDYDQHVTVTPALSNTIPVASALFGPAGIGVGAVIYLGQKMFKSIPEKVDKILSREYSITGDWKQPIIERI